MFTFISLFHFIHSLFSYCDVREILHNDRNRIPINLHLSILLSCSTVSQWGANDSLVLNPDAKAAKICQHLPTGQKDCKGLHRD